MKALPKSIRLTLALFLFSNIVLAQSGLQTIRGKVTDLEAKFPLIGVTVSLLTDSAALKGSATNETGDYRLENITPGRYIVKFAYLGYKDIVIPNVEVTSGKEVILNIEMEESAISVEAVEVTASRKGEVGNEMAITSARRFSIEETERYAGSRGDPARMASNFAGCQGNDDSRNDILVRGNSPMGVLWRLEGIDIPSPNHFSISGSTGGPVGILNNKVLSNSDFFTGAFPAEFGNSTAAVFDVTMRKGNNEKNEFTGQFGFLGTELLAEGPLSKKKGSSFIANYRYSTTSIFHALGIDIGTDAIPKYMDGAFKLNFPQKNGAALSFFGIGGTSNIDILISEQKEPSRELYGQGDRDQYFGSSMGVVGAKYMKTLKKKTFMRAVIGVSGEEQHSRHEFIIRHLDNNEQFVIDSIYPILYYDFRQYKLSSALNFTTKKDKKNSIAYGATADHYLLQYNDSTFVDTSSEWVTRWDNRSPAALLQAFVQWKHKFNDDLVFHAGLHSQYFTLNGSFSPLEPRLGLSWDFSDKQSLSFGTGLHSQLPPLYTYFYFTKNLPDKNTGGSEPFFHNIGMDFLKSNHYVLTYNNSISKQLRLKLETYYQYLFNISVERDPSSFSMLNQGSGFVRFMPDQVVNKGTGFNYGIEFTLEKFFSNSYFFMITGALYESKYKGSDGILRDTDFNGNYVFNILGTKEFKIGEKSVLGIGGKVTTAGGKRYGPVNETASRAINEVVYIDDTYNSLQQPYYLRTDLKINYKINAKKVTHDIGLDIVNISDRKNILNLTYAPDPADPGVSPIRENYQLGRLPIFYYRIDF